MLGEIREDTPAKNIDRIERRLAVLDCLIAQIKNLSNAEYYTHRIGIAEKCANVGRFDNAWWYLFDCPDEGEAKFYLKLIEEEAKSVSHN